jgi:hypothetical protein
MSSAVSNWIAGTGLAPDTPSPCRDDFNPSPTSQNFGIKSDYKRDGVIEALFGAFF